MPRSTQTETRQLELPFWFSRDEPAGDGRILLGGRMIGYTLRRSRKRRSIVLVIDERGLRVSVPWRARHAAIETELRRHEAWILRKHAEWVERRPVPCTWRDGETLLLLGEALRLTLSNAPQAVCRQADRLVVGALPLSAPQAIAGQVKAWLREQALACFHSRVSCHLPLLGVAEPRVRLSNAKTRWGSCHAAGRISLNWRLIQMPLRLIDYVVVHELAHLREMNHSPGFWRIVADVLPDYAARRRELRADGPRYTVI